MMHAVRLLLMGIEILNDGHLTVQRPENNLLLDIRLGKYTLDEVIAMTEKYMDCVDLAYLNSKLPHSPDEDAISQLCVELHEEFWKEHEVNQMLKSRDIHKAASYVRTAEVLSTRNPRKIVRHIRNKIIGKIMYRITNPLYRK